MNSVKSFCLIFVTSLLLTACGTTSKTGNQVQQPVDDKVEQTNQRKRELTVDDYLTRAGEANTAKQASIWYTRAVDGWIKQANYLQAYTLLQQLDVELLSDYMQQQYNLFHAETLLQLGQLEQSFQVAQALEPLVNFEARVWLVKAQSAANTQQHYVAAVALIELANYLPEMALTANSEQIWFHLTQLENVALNHFQSAEQPVLSGWMSLLAITRQYAKDPTTMLINIRHWQAQYPSHPAASQLPDTLIAALESKPFKPERIAVLLPLSGKFARQGQAVQQGIMAANFANNELLVQQLTFIDTAANDLQALALDYDFVIGPLLKQNIELITQAHPDLPMLLLNQVNELMLAEHQFAFSLSPEGEAKQAATKLAESGYKHPIVIAANNSYGRRIAQSFIETFEAIADVKPQVAYFKNPKEMEQTVEALMATKESKQRIKTIKSLFGNHQKFKAEARNRRDIDLIYVHGNTTQIKLLKPYVDVNTAPFAKPAPIFSTSHGYSNDLNIADYKDLNGVKFSEMPWLLPRQQQDSPLAQEMNALWQQSKNDNKRLFAFGYDAFNLIPNLAQMRVFPGFHQQGLSGTLLVEQNGVINRQLVWAQYKNDKVRRFESLN